MDLKQTTLSNSTIPNNDVTIQLSYSTADVEQHIFYGQHLMGPQRESTGKVMLIAVHGVAHPLVDEAPEGSIPFSKDSGLLKITEIDRPA